MLVAALPISGYAQKKPVLTEDQRIRLEQTYINATREKMLQNYDEAIKLFTECLKLDENNAAVYFQLADLNYLKRQYADAEKFALRATQLNFYFRNQATQLLFRAQTGILLASCFQARWSADIRLYLLFHYRAGTAIRCAGKPHL